MRYRLAFSAAALTLAAQALSAQLAPTPGGPFVSVDVGYKADFFAGGLDATGLTFDLAGNLIRRSGDGTTLYFYGPGTALNHGAPEHTIVNTVSRADLSSGWGIARKGATLYAPAGGNLWGIDLATLTPFMLPDAAGNTGAFYGLKVAPNGNLVYNAGNTVREYDFATSTSSLLYNSGTFIDDVAIAPNGYIFAAALGDCTIRVLDPFGALVNTISSGHCADGSAFGAGAIFGNNTDGTVTRYDFAGPNFSGAFTTSVIVENGGCYHDFGAVGPDGRFYLDVDCVHYPDGTVEFGRHVATLEFIGGGGFGNVPEPATVALFGTGLAGIGGLAWRRRRA
jgi:hypothetical protein